MKNFCLILLIGIFILFNTVYGQIPPGVQVRHYQDLEYGIMTPPNYDTTQNYPLIIYLHCSGCNGYGNVKWYVNTGYQSANPSFIYTPLCPPGFGNWGFNTDSTFVKPIRLAMEVLDSLIAEFPIDTNRLYIHGKSMGGFGTINVISKQPGRFAAAYSESGGGDPITAPECSQTPLWLFHGSLDQNVPVALSLDLYNAIIDAGGKKVRYTEFPGEYHEISYQVDHTSGLNSWIFAQDKSVVHGSPDPAQDVSINQLDNWTTQITWTPPDETLKDDNQVWYYEVIRDGAVLDTLTPAQNSYIDSHLTEDVTYTYEIKTTNYFFESSLTNAVEFKTALDQTPPSIVTADIYEAKESETKIFISFDEKMTRASCENPANYALSGGVQVLNAVQWADKQNVVITTTPLDLNVEYELNIKDVQDSSLTKNKIADGTNIPVMRKKWLTAHIGTWQNPGTVLLESNSVTLNIEGDYISPNYTENVLFANTSVDGEYTLSARINEVNSPDVKFRTGIMIRNNLEPESDCFALSVTNTRFYRTSRSGETFTEKSLQNRITFPLYLRISRSGGTFSVYTSTDGINWGESLENVTDFLDSTTFTGLYATPFDGGYVTATFDNIDFPNITSLGEDNITNPLKYDLIQNYPNPFNPETVIEFSIPTDEFVSIRVFDILGRKVSELVNEKKQAGKYSVKFDGSNLSSGIYFYTITAGDYQQVKKMVLTK